MARTSYLLVIHSLPYRSHLAALGWVVHRSWVTAIDETAGADARLYTQVNLLTPTSNPNLLTLP